MPTHVKSIALFALASFLGAVGQYLFKTGVKNVPQNVLWLLLSPRILTAVFLYILVMALFMAAFRLGGELTVLYPVYATTFIWAALIGTFLLHESLSAAKAVGMALIILGVFFIAK